MTDQPPLINRADHEAEVGRLKRKFARLEREVAAWRFNYPGLSWFDEVGALMSNGNDLTLYADDDGME